VPLWLRPFHEEQALKPFDKIDCRIVLCQCWASGRLRCIPEKPLFSLLSDVRLAKAFSSCGCNSKPIEHWWPFCTLILPKKLYVATFKLNWLGLTDYVSYSIVCFPVNGSSITFCRQDLHCISALADSPQVPYTVCSLAFVARHDRVSGGLIGAA
jgi:hypothetical protein